MGNKSKRRHHPNRWSGEKAESGPKLVSGGPVEPPWCPLVGGVIMQQTHSRVVQAGGAKMVDIACSFVPLECLRSKCMFWDFDADPPQCGFLSLLGEVLGDEDSEDGDEDGDGQIQD